MVGSGCVCVSTPLLVLPTLFFLLALKENEKLEEKHKLIDSQQPEIVIGSAGEH
jgi:hypothetical protein